MMSALCVDTLTWGLRITDVYGWPEWTFEAELDWRTGRVCDLRVLPPPKARRNVRRPSERELQRITALAERMSGHGTGTLLDFVAAAVPEPRGSKKPGERAKAVTAMYLTALQQGYSPRRAISAVYGLPMEPAWDSEQPSSGTRTEYSSTLERWLKEAHAGPLGPFNRERHTPRRWPARTPKFEESKAAKLEPKRAPAWKNPNERAKRRKGGQANA
ncbi:hypothetical protein [Streptomyces sp. PT12]|uniref:hypothetical protein n=1 Tax=Streptomyces sp. PT12 TaxID=1510197 RepID=UPI0011BE81D0|nr:hypothetical protein [Streptomyces sp. PT12]